MKKLNLGCGKFKKEGYVNVDFLTDVDADIVHDLNKIPYPFPNDSFILIEADHVLEHLDSPFCVMKELYRVACNDASIVIKVPHFTRGFMHPEHKRGFDVTFGYYFNPSFKGGYQGIELILERVKLNWFAQPYLKKQHMSTIPFYGCLALSKCINFFANLNPFICSKIWCFWFGGFDEVEFQFIVKK